MAFDLGSTSLGKFRADLASAQQLATHLTGTETRWNLDSQELNGDVVLGSVDVGSLIALSTHGHEVEISVHAGTWSLFVRLGDGDDRVMEAEGPIQVAVNPPRVKDLERAIARLDPAAALELLEGQSAKVSLKIVNKPDQTGTHWIASANRLVELSQAQWLPVATSLATGPARLLIDDLGRGVVETQGLVIFGNEASADMIASVTPSPAAGDRDFLLRRSSEIAYPSPLRYANSRPVVSEDPVQTESACLAMNTISFLLIWALLATTSEPSAGALQLTLSGAREVELVLDATSVGGVDELARIYTWVALSPETDRLDFAQQALTLAIVSSADALNAAGPALRTAKSLYELSRRGSVAEAMAARRSARDAAISASRGAAAAARETAAKAVERTVLQVVAAAGVVVAQLKGGLSTGQAVGLLLVIVVLCVALLGVTHFVTIASARTNLEKELADLDQYRDSLSIDDIAAIKGAGVIGSAESDLDSACVTAWLAYIGTGLAASAAAVVLGCVGTTSPALKDPKPTPVPATVTVSPSASATVTASPATKPPRPPTSDQSDPSRTAWSEAGGKAA